MTRKQKTLLLSGLCLFVLLLMTTSFTICWFYLDHEIKEKQQVIVNYARKVYRCDNIEVNFVKCRNGILSIDQTDCEITFYDSSSFSVNRHEDDNRMEQLASSIFKMTMDSDTLSYHSLNLIFKSGGYGQTFWEYDYLTSNLYRKR